MSTPLNPDALKAVEDELWDRHIDYEGLSIGYGEVAELAVSTYLAVAQPVVSSVEELDALPTETVVRDSDGEVWERWVRSWRTVGVIHEFVGEEAVVLPATVLHRP